MEQRIVELIRDQKDAHILLSMIPSLYKKKFGYELKHEGKLSKFLSEMKCITCVTTKKPAYVLLDQAEGHVNL
jgi:hypothetical protein